jgi:hypothetical protein
VATPVARESRLAIYAFLVQSPYPHGKTKRTRSFPEPQSASRAGRNAKSKTQTRATPACEKNYHKRRPCGEPLKRNGYAGAFARFSHEDRKDAVDQARVPGDAASGTANSSRNVRGGRQRVCKKSRLAGDTPSRGTADRILQRRQPALAVAGTVTSRLKSIDSVTTATGQRKAVGLPMRQP